MAPVQVVHDEKRFGHLELKLSIQGRPSNRKEIFACIHNGIIISYSWYEHRAAVNDNVESGRNILRNNVQPQTSKHRFA